MGGGAGVLALFSQEVPRARHGAAECGGRNESVVDRAVTPRPSSVCTEPIETLCIRKKGSTPTPLS